MNAIQIRLVYDRKHTATATKPALIQIEVSFEGKRKFVGTHVKVLPKQWKNGRIVGRADAIQLNDRISAQIREIEELVEAYNKQRIRFTLDAIDKINEGYTTIDFPTFMAQRIEERHLEPGTKKHHRAIMTFLQNEYKGLRGFADLTVCNLQTLDEYLHRRTIATNGERRPMTQTTIHNYHKIIRHYINEAITMGYMKENPYARLKIERGKPSERVVLTMEEIDLMHSFHCHSILDRKVRDLFIVQCYTGLSYADLMAIDWEKRENKEGNWVIKDERQKTGEGFFITLLPRVLEVLERYRGRLPRLSYDVYNRNLKAVATAAGIKKHVTTHIGRHTFATTIALGSGIPIEVVAKMMGHADIKTTQIYAKIMPKAVLEGFDTIKEHLG